VIPPAQLVEQVLEMDRWTRSLRAQFLPQPFADRLADRSTGFPIDLHALAGGLAIHDRFRLIRNSNDDCKVNRPASKLFPRSWRRGPRLLQTSNEKKQVPPTPKQKAPPLVERGQCNRMKEDQ
jgi:hypothetical protein